MKRYCACGKSVFVQFKPTQLSVSHQDLADHDLCHRCWRVLCQQVRAARLQVKPWWAVKRPVLYSYD